MIRSSICCVAEGISIDQESNNASIFNVIESMQAAGFPVMFQHAAYFCLWTRDINDPRQTSGDFTITMGDRILHATSVAIDFRDKFRHRSIVRVNGLVIPQPGVVSFKISVPQHSVAEYSFEVVAQPVDVRAVN